MTGAAVINLPSMSKVQETSSIFIRLNQDKQRTVQKMHLLTRTENSLGRFRMSCEKMEPFTDKELNNIEPLVNKVRGKMLPSRSAIRELSEIFKTRVRNIDITCGKCIGHMIEYFYSQCQNRK